MQIIVLYFVYFLLSHPNRFYMVVFSDKSERLQVEHCYFCKVAEHSNSITLLPFITVFNGQAFTVLVCLLLAARVLFGSQERIVS